MTQPSNRQHGALGEEMAAEYLIAHGMTVLVRNLRYPGGEVDLVMRDGNYTVFVEVKRRQGVRYGTGREAVNLPKQRRISAVALRYLQANALSGTPVRFDVVEIQDDTIVHLPNAFPYQPRKSGGGFF